MEKTKGEVKTNPKKPQSFRLSDEMRERLTACAGKTNLKVTELANRAIEAAVSAIEANDYKLVIPIEFDLEVRNVPAQRSTSTQEVLIEPPDAPGARSGGRALINHKQEAFRPAQSKGMKDGRGHP